MAGLFRLYGKVEAALIGSIDAPVRAGTLDGALRICGFSAYTVGGGGAQKLRDGSVLVGI